MGRSLTLVLFVSVLLEKMAGNEWAVMWHQDPNLHEVTQKRMDTKATVRFSKGDVNVTNHSDLQTPGHAFSRYKNTHQVTRAEVKTVQKLLICRVLWAQGWCSTRCSMTCTEDPGAGAGGGPGRGRRQTVLSPYSSHPVLCLALVQGGGCTDSIPALRLLI